MGWAQVRQLCEAMGEEVQVCSYERFTSLTVEADGLQGGYRNVQPGDCIVAFSRKSIFAIKQVQHASFVPSGDIQDLPALAPAMDVLSRPCSPSQTLPCTVKRKTTESQSGQGGCWLCISPPAILPVMCNITRH